MEASYADQVSRFIRGLFAKKRGGLGWAIFLLALLVWWRLPGPFAALLFPFVWLTVVQLVFAGSFEAARLRRRAWLGQYLKRSSPWSHWLRGGVVMVIWHQLTSAALAAVLLVSLRLSSPLEMTPLLIGAGVWWVCVARVRKRLVRHIIPEYLFAVTRQLLVAPVSALVVVGLVVVSLVRPQPYLVGLELSVALQQPIAASGASLLGVLERGASALELASFWVVQNAFNELGVGGVAAVLGWAGVFAMQGVLALAFMRLLVGVAAAQDVFQRLSGRSAVGAAQPDDSVQEEGQW